MYDVFEILKNISLYKSDDNCNYYSLMLIEKVEFQMQQHTNRHYIRFERYDWDKNWRFQKFFSASLEDRHEFLKQIHFLMVGVEETPLHMFCIRQEI